MLEKRSLALAGHRTSVALEPEFWAALEALARARGLSLSALVVEIDGQRQTPLASALRVHALHAASQAGGTASGAAPHSLDPNPVPPDPPGQAAPAPAPTSARTSAPTPVRTRP